MPVRQEHELLNAHAACAAREQNFVDISPQQRAWFMGVRCGLAYALGLKKGGRKVEEFMSDLPTPAVVSPTEGDDFLKRLREAPGQGG